MKTILCPSCGLKFKLNRKRVKLGKLMCPRCEYEMRVNGWEVT